MIEAHPIALPPLSLLEIPSRVAPLPDLISPLNGLVSPEPNPWQLPPPPEDHPDLRVTGYKGGLFMVVYDPESGSAQIPNLGDVVNEFIWDKKLSLTLDTPEERIACALAIKDSPDNVGRVDPITNELTEFARYGVVIPAGVCYAGIPGITDPEAQVQATAQIVFNQLEEETSQNEMRNGIILGIGAVGSVIFLVILLNAGKKYVDFVNGGYGRKTEPTVQPTPSQFQPKLFDSMGQLEKHLSDITPNAISEGIQVVLNYSEGTLLARPEDREDVPFQVLAKTKGRPDHTETSYRPTPIYDARQREIRRARFLRENPDGIVYDNPNGDLVGFKRREDETGVILGRVRLSPSSITAQKSNNGQDGTNS